MHVNSSRCNHADASQPMYHPYQRWRCRSVTWKFRSCSRDTIPSTVLKILRIVKGASNFVGVDVVVERRNCWLALSSEGRGPVCCGHGTDRVWFANSKKLKKTYKLSSCLFFWEWMGAFFDDAESVGGPHSTKIPCWKMTDAEEKFLIFTDKLPAGCQPFNCWCRPEDRLSLEQCLRSAWVSWDQAPQTPGVTRVGRQDFHWKTISLYDPWMKLRAWLVWLTWRSWNSKVFPKMKQYTYNMI